MRNPFTYGVIASGNSFCNRTEEMEQLVRAAENGEKLLIHGNRRTGKTSLLKRTIRNIEETGGLCFYIDVWKCFEPSDFTRICGEAFAGYAERGGSALQKLSRIFSGISPSFSIGDDGKIALSFVPVPSADEGIPLRKLLEAPMRISEMEPGRTILVVMDEFQQVRKISGTRYERIIRSVIQEQQDIAWFFCGSSSTILMNMFQKRSSPLYRSCGQFPLGSIPSEHWRKHITDMFEGTGKTISDEALTLILNCTEGIPGYTQQLCHALWDLTDKGAEAHIVAKAVDLLIDREAGSYLELLHSLPDMPVKMLKAIARENPLHKPTSGRIVKTYGFTSSSGADAALKRLLREGHAVRTARNGYMLENPFLSLWCRERL